MSELGAIEREILLRCSDDYTGLWEAIRAVQRSDPKATSKEVQQVTLELIAGLLQKDLILAGCPRRDGSGFDAWNLLNAQIVKRIEQEWNELGQEPTIGDVVWFVSTTEGDKVLAEGRERNVLKESDH